MDLWCRPLLQSIPDLRGIVARGRPPVVTAQNCACQGERGKIAGVIVLVNKDWVARCRSRCWLAEETTLVRVYVLSIGLQETV